jgi:hypothetical protein
MLRRCRAWALEADAVAKGCQWSVVFSGLLIAAPCRGLVQRLAPALGLNTLPEGMPCWYCCIMIQINSINLATASMAALRRWVSPNQSLELTAMESGGSARKGKEEFALSGLGKRLLAAAQVGRYSSGLKL